MKHQPDPGDDFARRAACWAGVVLSEEALEQLRRFADWLAAEAIPAGGLGPAEGPRIWQRHIADAITFAVGWRDRPPARLLDVGTGVGLPGIPLGLLYPSCEVALLDRGGRRIRLVERVRRVLALDNVTTVHRDVSAVSEQYDALTFRGSLRPGAAVAASARLLAPGGTAVVGLTRRADPPALGDVVEGEALRRGLRTELVGIPPEVLDGPSWLLIIRRSGHTPFSG